MSKNKTRLAILTICLVLAAFFLTSCVNPAATVYLSDVLTMKASEGNRIKVTITANENVDLAAFEAAVEAKYDDIDLVIVGDFSAEFDLDVEKKMERNDLTDLVLFPSPDAGDDHQEERLVDLSALPLTSKYSQFSLNKVRKDGKIYMAPLPREVSYVVYNKTLLDERNLEKPEDFGSFTALAAKVTELTGGETRGFQAGLYDDDTLNAMYFMFGYQPCWREQDSERWAKEYNERSDNASFSFTDPAYKNFLKLLECGAVETEGKSNDFVRRSAGITDDMIERNCAMTIGGAGLMQRLRDAGESGATGDVFGVMPFYSGDTGSGWVLETTPGYYGMNRKLTEHRERYDAAYRVLDYMSTTEGQNVLIRSGNGHKTNLSGSEKQLLSGRSGNADWYGLEELSDLLQKGKIANHGGLNRTATEEIPKAIRAAFKEKTYQDGQITDGETAATAAETFGVITAAVDLANKETELRKGRYLAAASEDFTTAETGAMIADAMRQSAGAEIALYLDDGKDGAHNALGVGSKLYLGEIYERDLDRILPVLPDERYGKLVLVGMRGENILHALENALYAETGEDGFYYFSGLNVEYRPTAARGSRVVSVTTEGGVPINNAYVYTVAISNGTVSGDYIVGEEDTGKTVRSVVANAAQRLRTLSPAKDGRFRIVA